MKIQFPNRFGEVLVGDLHKGKSVYCLVLCHGFCSHRHLGIIAHVYDTFVKHNVSVFRFDFSGNGQSQGEWEKSTYVKQPKDLNDALNYLQREFGFEHFVTLGHSMAGGAVLFEASSDDRVVGVISLAGVAYPNKIEEREPERFSAGHEFHVPHVEGIDLPKRSYVLTRQYLDDAKKLDVMSNLPTVPVLALHGINDNRIPDSYSEAVVAKTNGELKLLKTDHFFADVKDEVCKAITTFLDSMKT